MRSRALRALPLPVLALVALASAPASADTPAPAPPPPSAATGAPFGASGPAPFAPSGAPFAPSGAPFAPSGAPFARPRAAPARAGDGLLPSEAAAQFKQKKQLILAGSILFGLGYYGALAASSAGISRGGANSREYIPGLFPVAGPFITAGLRAAPNGSSGFINAPPAQGDFAGMSLYLALGAVQVVGAGIFIAGLRMPTGRPPPECSDQADTQIDTSRPCPQLRFSFAPVVAPGFAGGGFTGRF